MVLYYQVDQLHRVALPAFIMVVQVKCKVNEKPSLLELF